MDNKDMLYTTDSDTNVRLTTNIFEKMEGRLTVKTSKHKPHKVLLEIPFDIYDEDGNLKINAEPEADFDFRGCRALLISDDEKCRRWTLELLGLINIESDGYTAMDKGMEQFESQPAGTYQLVFVNIKQLSRQVYSFAERMRRHDKALVIFAVTDMAFSRTVLEEFKAEIDEYFVKPLDAKQLYDKLKEHLKKSE